MGQEIETRIWIGVWFEVSIQENGYKMKCANFLLKLCYQIGKFDINKHDVNTLWCREATLRFPYRHWFYYIKYYTPRAKRNFISIFIWYFYTFDLIGTSQLSDLSSHECQKPVLGCFWWLYGHVVQWFLSLHYSTPKHGRLRKWITYRQQFWIGKI